MGHSCGIGLLWKSIAHVSLVNYSQNHVNLVVSDNVHGACRLTGFYGYLERRRRRASWDVVRSLATDPNTPWCCIRDFNDLLC